MLVYSLKGSISDQLLLVQLHLVTSQYSSLVFSLENVDTVVVIALSLPSQFSFSLHLLGLVVPLVNCSCTSVFLP